MIKLNKKIFTVLLFSIFLLTNLNATSLSDFLNTSKFDQIIDKQYYKICYSYKYKGAIGGWTTLHGDKVNIVNIKKDLGFIIKKIYL